MTASAWSAERRVVARLEHSGNGDNPRYIATHLEGQAQS
jgi:hypothetical protein